MVWSCEEDGTGECSVNGQGKTRGWAQADVEEVYRARYEPEGGSGRGQERVKRH